MFRYAIALAVFLAAAPAAQAKTNDVGLFDVYLGGLRAGTLAFSGVEDGGRYTSAAEIRTSGLIRLLSDVRYDARSAGTIAGGRYVPSRYEEVANTGKRATESQMDYEGGVPQVKVYSPPQKPRPEDLDPATQGGTLDPMTTIYALLRDVPRSEACTLDVFMFDGRRRSQVEMQSRSETGDGIVCTGVYRRVAGFKPKEMADRVEFPFELTYTPAEGRDVRVTRVEFATLYGKAIFVRR